MSTLAENCSKLHFKYRWWWDTVKHYYLLFLSVKFIHVFFFWCPVCVFVTSLHSFIFFFFFPGIFFYIEVLTFFIVYIFLIYVKKKNWLFHFLCILLANAVFDQHITIVFQGYVSMLSCPLSFSYNMLCVQHGTYTLCELWWIKHIGQLEV